jgi:hypothetical protein
VLNLLLSKGADVNQLGEEGLTPLMTAVYAASRTKGQWLLGESAIGGDRLPVDRHLATGCQLLIELNAILSDQRST